MKIGIDLDNVVVELTNGFCGFYSSKFGKKLSIEDCGAYLLSEILGISREEELSLWEEYYSSDLFDEMKFIEGGKEAIEILKKEHSLFFITARNLAWKEKTENFFKEHFGEVNLIFSGEVYGGKTKDEICGENDINILVEDHLEHSLGYAEKGIKVLLLDQPWNRDGEGHENITRVKTWEEILEKICEVKKNG